MDVVSDIVVVESDIVVVVSKSPDRFSCVLLTELVLEVGVFVVMVVESI